MFKIIIKNIFVLSALSFALTTPDLSAQSNADSQKNWKITDLQKSQSSSNFHC